MFALLFSIYIRSTMIAWSAVDLGTESLISKINAWNISMSCFSAKHTEIRSKNKDLNGLESELCVRVEWHVYLHTVTSESYHYKNIAQCDGPEQSGQYHLIKI
jgi:hypothetical protein